jgi:hypothetical protein
MTMVLYEFLMKKMAAGAFKANYLAVMDEVRVREVTVSGVFPFDG